MLVGVAAPLAAILLWGRFAAPKSEHRLPDRLRIPFELTVFALACLALVAAGAPLAGAVFALLAALNTAALAWSS